MRRRLPLALLAFAGLVVLAACSPPPPPVVLDPAGPLSARVGTTVDFEVLDYQGAVTWSVDGTPGGTTASGTVTDGTYQAPARIPTDSTVSVTAAAVNDPSNAASAEVLITAPGTLYVLGFEEIYVYDDLDVTDGDLVPSRTFGVDGVTGREYFDMVLAPALDVAFISTYGAAPHIFRVANVSAADGTVTATTFAAAGSWSITSLQYDAARDILYALSRDGELHVFDGASTAADGHSAARIVQGPSLTGLLDRDARMSLDGAADRLFVSHPEGTVAVFEDASTIDGEVAPDRLIDVDHPVDFLWGAAYDASRDELYLADQTVGQNIYVIAEASTADGLVAPSRIIGGPGNLLESPSQIGYDVANDRLVAVDTDNDDIKVYDAASTLDGDVAPSRIIGGTNLPINYSFGLYLDPTQ